MTDALVNEVLLENGTRINGFDLVMGARSMGKAIADSLLVHKEDDSGNVATSFLRASFFVLFCLFVTEILSFFIGPFAGISQRHLSSHEDDFRGAADSSCLEFRDRHEHDQTR